jgi:mono/diheme cytochrome c family protein
MRLRFALAAPVLAWAAAAWAQPVSAPASAPPPPAAGDAAKGQSLYQADGCFQCHGGVGQGARATGPRLARTQLPFDAFLQQLRHPSNEMPPYETGVVSEAEARDIYAFVQGLPDAPSAKDIPLLNQ